MSKASAMDRKWNQRPSAPGVLGADALRAYFENSPDAIWLFDPVTGVFVDCNRAAVALMRCESREQLLQSTPVDFAPPFQQDGRPTFEKAAEITAQVAAQGSLRFEWLAKRPDGTVFPIEALATVVPVGDR